MMPEQRARKKSDQIKQFQRLSSTPNTVGATRKSSSPLQGGSRDQPSKPATLLPLKKGKRNSQSKGRKIMKIMVPTNKSKTKDKKKNVVRAQQFFAHLVPSVLRSSLRWSAFHSQSTVATELTEEDETGDIDLLLLSDRSDYNSEFTCTSLPLPPPRRCSSFTVNEPKAKRRVRFPASPRATQKVHSTLSRSQYTLQERQACWYQKIEFVAISKRCCKTVRKMDRASNVAAFFPREGETFCTRGLESFTRRAQLPKSLNRQDSMAVVLIEQKHQRSLFEKIVDDEAICERYQNVSSSSELWARLVGLRDQRVAHDLYEEVEES